MKISYAITVCNEHKEINKLLNFLFEHKRKEDQVVVQMDTKATKEVWKICESFEGRPFDEYKLIECAKWGWRVTEDGWVNFPDWQMRIYQNIDTIYWVKPVHEQLKGYTKFANLPPEEKFALYHPKNIGRQEQQNSFYEII